MDMPGSDAPARLVILFAMRRPEVPPPTVILGAETVPVALTAPQPIVPAFVIAFEFAFIVVTAL